MALTITSRGTGTHNTGATTLVPGGRTATLAARSMGVFCIAVDNAGGAGDVIIAPTSWTDAKGNVWTRRASALYDNGAASAGIEMAIYTAGITTALLTTDLGTITWNTGVSPVAKAFTWYEIIPSSASLYVEYDTSGTIAGATAANAQVITASILVGDGVIAGYFSENVAAVTGDSDSTNGTWTAQQTATIGTTTSGVRIATQQKVQTTANSTQSYDVTVASQDRIAGYIAVKEILTQGFGQAQADIKATGQAFGQAQADIKTQGRGYGQAQADIEAVGQGCSQAQAAIKAVGNGLGQSQADIKAISNGSGQANSDIKATLRGFGQAQSDIKANGLGFAQSQAMIYRRVWYDTFSRTLSGEFGKSDDEHYYYDASYGIEIGSGYASTNFSAQSLSTTLGISIESPTIIQFDFYISTIFSFAAYNEQYIINIQNQEGWAVWISGVTTYNLLPFSPIDGDWWTVKAFLDGNNTTTRLKVWKTGTIEPDWANISIISTPVTTLSGISLTGAVTSEVRIDNLTHLTSNNTPTWTQIGTGQAQADIKAVNRAFGQAQTDIKAISNGFGQAQVLIAAPAANQCAQAQADIKQTYFGSGQSQADIKATGQGYGQSQADIKSVNNGLGQANSDIKAINSGFAQAQADIKQTQNGYGQAQSDIKAIQNAFGQAQSDIKQIYYGSGQSQADIKAIQRGFGQAQSDIKATQYGLGQANSDIKAVGYGSGQSGADIKTQGYGSGQAQCRIAPTLTGSGQANADIKATLYQTGQAQVDIKTTQQGYGQAQCSITVVIAGWGQAQADIKSTYQSSAQAQADIQQITNVSSQAQADIKTTLQGSGQAQGAIQTTVNSVAQAQAQIKTTNYSTAQAQAQIISIGIASAQAQAAIVVLGIVATAQAQALISKTAMTGQAQVYIFQPHTLKSVDVSIRETLRLTIAIRPYISSISSIREPLSMDYGVREF